MDSEYKSTCKHIHIFLLVSIHTYTLTDVFLKTQSLKVLQNSKTFTNASYMYKVPHLTLYKGSVKMYMHEEIVENYLKPQSSSKSIKTEHT